MYVHVKSLQSYPTLCDPMDCSTPGSSIHGFFRQEYWSGLPCLPPGDPPNPGIEPRFPALQVDSLPTESAGKPKNTGVGKLSFLQGIFPTQQLEWGLLHCRRILYQLSYQGSPNTQKTDFNFPEFLIIQPVSVTSKPFPTF